MPMWWGMSGFYNGLATETQGREQPQSEIKTRTLEHPGSGPAEEEGIERAASRKRPVLKLLLRTDGKVHIKSIRCGAQP
jgi:hypothetical protein